MSNQAVTSLLPSSNISLFFQRSKAKELTQSRILKLGVWAYFLLLIFEGALRKWVVPSLATPLLIVRDPIAMLLIYKVWQQGKLKSNIYLIGMTGISVIGIFTAYFFGHGNIFVALYGARILMIHFPFIFVVGAVFDRDDVVKMGKVLLWIAIPMSLLIGVQFFSPQSAFVNQGVGGDEGGAGFSGALGYFRPPGTFSFTNGTTLFFEFVTVFIFYFWISSEKFNKIVLLASTIALIVAIPLSISRGLFFFIGVTFLFALVAVSRKPAYFNKILYAIFGIGFLGVIMSQLPFAQTALNALLTRFTTADQAEGGVQGVLIDRYLGGLVNALSSSSEVPYFGFGLGMGTNVGAVLLTGKAQFLIAEGDWGRIIGELGALLGILVIVLRVGICVELANRSYKKLILSDFLPWLLLSFVLLNVPQGKWAQATALGFSALSGGLLLASFNTKNDINDSTIPL